MGKKPKAKKKNSGKIWILLGVLTLIFCAWVYWGNLPARPRPSPAKPRPQVARPEVRPGPVSAPAKEKPSSPAVRPGPVRALTASPAGEEERSLMEKIRRSEGSGRTEEADQARFELADLYLQKALWEWTEVRRNGSDLELVRKTLAILDEVIRSRPGTERAAQAQLRRAKVYHNGLSGLWDQGHQREARLELNKALELYPRSAAAREAREILANLGK